MNTTTGGQYNTQLATQLSQELSNRYNFIVSPQWLTEFLSTVRNPPPPLPALASTANFRLLNSDFTQSLSRSITGPHGQNALLLPVNITDVNTKQLRIPNAVPVQVLDILDVGSSKWNQIEAIERVERGEEVRGREVIRTVPIMNEEDGSGGSGNGHAAANSTSTATSIKKTAGPHKLLLQDAAGTKVWGFELASIPRVFVTMTVEEGGLQIGAKLLLKQGVVVRRGMVMLEPNGVIVLGGKVEEWDKKWRVSRKNRLADEMKREFEQQPDED